MKTGDLSFTAHLFAGPPEIKRFLTTYCTDCHGAEKQKGDRRFDKLLLPAAKVDTLIELKDIMDQIHLGEMPPKKSPQPSPAEQKAFLEQVAQALAEGRESLTSTDGSTVLRRLNRREYLNTIGDLFAMNMAAFDPTTKFPRDQSAEHMENLGDVLQTSAYLLDQYLEAADTVVEKVFALQQPLPEKAWHFVGDFGGKSKSEKKRKEYDNLHLLVLECMDSEKHVGGYAFINDFKDGVPADGFYEIQVLVQAMNRQHPYDTKIFGTDAREPFRLGLVPGDAKSGPLDLPQPLQPMLAELALNDGEAEWRTMKVWLDAGHTPRFVFPNGPKDARTTWFKIAEYHKNKWSRQERENGKRGIGIVEARAITLTAQTRRMLASPRSDAFVSGFLDSWLNLRSLGGMPPDRKDFETYYSKGLEHAFKQETRLFMRDLIERDASIVNFLNCDYGFVNQPLATHYGLGDLGDPRRAHEFRKVSFTDSRRGGLLGMGSLLTITANGIETSPVVRGVYLLENILGTPPPPPPDDVPAIDPDVRGAKSMRELLSKHRASPNCAGCHQKIDPLGFALENFDPVGGWRTSYGKTPIDTAGELPGGEKFSDVAGLKMILVKRQDLFARMLTDRLLTYACGRRIGALDEPSVAKIVSGLPKHQHGLRSLLEAVVTSELFLSR